MKTYTKEEIITIRKLLRTTKDPVMYRKYLVIRLHMNGQTNKSIAEMVDLAPHTVGIYINTYKSQGIDGLVPKKPPGRPRFLTKKQESELIALWADLFTGLIHVNTNKRLFPTTGAFQDRHLTI
jgi:hypothetical protein